MKVNLAIAKSARDIKEITGHAVPDLSQNNLVKRINYNLKENKYDIRADSNGVCQGLSAMS